MEHHVGVVFVEINLEPCRCQPSLTQLNFEIKQDMPRRKWCVVCALCVTLLGTLRPLLTILNPVPTTTLEKCPRPRQHIPYQDAKTPLLCGIKQDMLRSYCRVCSVLSSCLELGDFCLHFVPRFQQQERLRSAHVPSTYSLGDDFDQVLDIDCEVAIVRFSFPCSKEDGENSQGHVTPSSYVTLFQEAQLTCKTKLVILFP
ncbi:hypothetical protein IV203_007751 [Nitzschia inconspicua]|uniref:Uncharacterized protein n=1 Tax=Nitzschia inconspicua TaxID=303405 RepID=A0A9K3PLI2_9STRA|nr:hypothetical protein IV203_007751 [Nitzschia inconspicua]